MKVEIPEEIYKEIEDTVKNTEEFKTVDEYVTFVLSEILKEDTEEDEGSSMSEEDEEKVKERLRGLGYL